MITMMSGSGWCSDDDGDGLGWWRCLGGRCWAGGCVHRELSDCPDTDPWPLVRKVFSKWCLTEGTKQVAWESLLPTRFHHCIKFNRLNDV